MFISRLKAKYTVVAQQSKLCKDIQDFIALEKKEFVVDKSHLSLEKRKELINARKKELEKKEKNIEKDIDNDPKLSKDEKAKDKKRLQNHLKHYENGLDSIANAQAWRDAETISDAEWKKKALNAKGTKLASSRKGGIASFALPAGITCPKAGSCKNHCFALTGHTAYVEKVRDTHSASLGLTERDDFVKKMNEVIEKKFKGKKLDYKNPYRIHAWGDFFSNQYAKKWVEIIKSNPNVWFYMYTKSFTMPALKKLIADIKNKTIKNVKVIQSLNGEDDNHIDYTQPIAVVFKSRSDMDAWNAGVKGVDSATYEAQKAKNLTILQNKLNTMSEKDEKYAVLKKELRKLKKEKPNEREAAYAKLVNVLEKLKVYPKSGKFVECSDNDLVAADPSKKRIGIVEHGELHQPRTYKIEEVTAAADSFDIHCEQMQGH